jgi:excisionase family DNA binding protein
MPRLKGPPQPRKKLAARLYTIDQAADVLGMCRASVYNSINRGELTYLVIGGRRRIPVEIVENLLKIEA